MKTISAGPAGNFGIGCIRVVSSEEGKQLIDGGYAELIEEKKTIKEPEVKKVAPGKNNKKGKVKKDGK